MGSKDRRLQNLWFLSGYQSLVATMSLGTCCSCLVESSPADQSTAVRQQLRMFLHFEPLYKKYINAVLR